MNCKKCGIKLKKEYKFCENCGTPIDNYDTSNKMIHNESIIDNYAKKGFTLGLWSIIAWIIPLAGYPVTICGIINSLKGIKSKEKKNKAIIGLILSIVFLIITLINSIWGAILGAKGELF